MRFRECASTSSAPHLPARTSASSRDVAISIPIRHILSWASGFLITPAHYVKPAGIPYVMENVRAAEQVRRHAPMRTAGRFFLWGNGVPPLLPAKLTKGMKTESTSGARSSAVTGLNNAIPRRQASPPSPPELAAAVADYATRLYEQRKSA